jgi:LPPG:FO 2-phospho-L-lactate transferase
MRNDERRMMNDESRTMNARGDSGDSSFSIHPSAFIVALAGGVGGAKLADGLQRVLGEQLAVVVNTGDDFEHWGLAVCPDLDTVMYNLAGVNNPEFGWGLAGETHSALAMMRRYGGESWFGLGDGDLATHLLRTERLRSGLNLTQVTFTLKSALGVTADLLPMSDQPVRTMVHSDEGVLPFQRYFVQRRCEPRLLRLDFAGIETAQPSPQVLAALDKAGAVVLCPSNPYLSLDPILSLPGLAERLRAFTGPVVAVSPIVGGQALKGPAAKIMAELGVEASALAVAQHIAGRIRLDGFVLDAVDAHLAGDVASLGVTPLVTDTIMRDAVGKERLAREVLALATNLATTA